MYEANRLDESMPEEKRKGEEGNRGEQTSTNEVRKQQLQPVPKRPPPPPTKLRAATFSDSKQEEHSLKDIIVKEQETDTKVQPPPPPPKEDTSLSSRAPVEGRSAPLASIQSTSDEKTEHTEPTSESTIKESSIASEEEFASSQKEASNDRQVSFESLQKPPPPPPPPKQPKPSLRKGSGGLERSKLDETASQAREIGSDHDDTKIREDTQEQLTQQNSAEGFKHEILVETDATKKSPPPFKDAQAEVHDIRHANQPLSSEKGEASPLLVGASSDFVSTKTDKAREVETDNFTKRQGVDGDTAVHHGRRFETTPGAKPLTMDLPDARVKVDTATSTEDDVVSKRMKDAPPLPSLQKQRQPPSRESTKNSESEEHEQIESADDVLTQVEDMKQKGPQRAEAFAPQQRQQRVSTQTIPPQPPQAPYPRTPTEATAPSRIYASSAAKRPPPDPVSQREQLQSMPPRPPRAFSPKASAPPTRSNKSASAPPVLKSLWSRVEKGLDELASLDDRVAYQAQKLMSSATNTAWRRQTSKPQQRSQSTQSTASRTAAPPLGTPRARWQQQKVIQQKRTAPNNSPPGRSKPTTADSSKPSVTVHPYAASSSYSFLDMARAKHTTNGEKESSRKVDWSGLSGKTRKLMPANGGASAAPNGDRPGPQKDSQFELPNGPGGNVISQGPSSKAPPSEGSETPPDRQESQSQTFPPRASSIPSSPSNLEQAQKARSQEAYPRSFQSMSTAALSPDRTEQAQKSPSHSTSFAETFRSTMAAPTKSAPSRGSSRSSYVDYETDEKESLFSRVAGSIRVPRFSFIRRVFKLGKGDYDESYASLDAWKADDADGEKSKGFLGIFRRRRDQNTIVPVVTGKKAQSNTEVLPRQVRSLLERSDNGKTGSLLSSADEKRIGKIGKSRAILDLLSLAFLILGIRQIQGLETISFPRALSDVATDFIPGFLTALVSSVDSWSALALASALLTFWTNSLVFDGRIASVASEVADAAESEASYSRLFLRLLSSVSTDRGLPSKVFEAARFEVYALAELARLRSFVTYILATILFATVTFIQPFLLTIFGTVLHIGRLEEWRSWPMQIDRIFSKTKDLVLIGGRELTSLIESELVGAGHHPMQVAFKASILAALFAVACLPRMEKCRKIAPSEESEEENTAEVSVRIAEQISNTGASSAGRLGLLSKHNWAEGSIERWRIIHEESSKMARDISVRSLFRRVGYYVASWLILAMPLVIFGFLFKVPVVGWSAAAQPQWESLLEVAVLLLFTNGLVWNTVAKVMEASDLIPDITGFLESLARMAEEVIQKESTQRPLSTSMNPTAGLVVKDLWAAHTVKRAWAVRGANLSCRNGEVLVLLGDDGAGKSRLLTTLAESIILPPKRALSTTKVRGNISFGGIDITQWDQVELKKRVGIFLNDVRTMADKADMWSGMSVEEILEPGDGLKAIDPTHSSGATEKACMVLALKITGLYWTLLPRLPSKLSSVLTANEEDLRPSPLRPRYNVLSPTEWSKLIMAKLLAQQIFDNENSTGSSDKVDNSLVGSLFLLDDATSPLSETEETRLLRELRRTGAATVLSSNKWATGRLADRIAVVKDGAIVEIGTHNELLSRGPQHSLYAAKWHAMTSP